MTDAPDDRYKDLDAFANDKALKQTMVPAFTVHPPPPSLFHGVAQIFSPRNEALIRSEIRAQAAAAGADWYYSIPFKDRKTGKTTYVEGPTIELANAVHLIYTHAEVDSWVSGEGPDFIEITARWIDVEKGVAMTRVFRQRKGAAKIGGNDPARNMEADVAIGASKAIRNVIVNALSGMVGLAFEEARNSLVKKIGQDIEHYRTEVPERLGRMVDIHRVEAVVGKPVKDWVARDIAQVIAMGKTVTDGMATLDETFPPLMQPRTSAAPGLDAFAAGSPEASRPSGDTAAGPVTPSSPAASGLKVEMVDKVLKLASDATLDAEGRAKALESAFDGWTETLPDDRPLVDRVFEAAAKVSRGELKPEVARRSLKEAVGK